jgi:hypothetical protein
MVPVKSSIPLVGVLMDYRDPEPMRQTTRTDNRDTVRPALNLLLHVPYGGHHRNARKPRRWRPGRSRR